MFLRRKRLWTALSVFLLVAVFLPVAQAASGTLNFKVDCVGFVSQGSQLALNRDNTGALAEAFIISAIDGAGNTIFEPVSDVFFVGGAINWPAGDSYDWTTAPRYNPIRLQIVSVAGNGQAEQLVYENISNCPGLPNFILADIIGAFTKEALRRLTGEAFVLQPADGETSDPVELNAIPPRPINPPGLAESQPGYVVVNTDNLFLRSGDDPRYTVIGIVDGGTLLAVLGRNEDLTWWYIQVGGLRGWVSSEFLVLRGDLSGIPEIPVLGDLTPPSLYVGFSGNFVYADPLISSAPICTIPGNLEFPITGRTRSTTWYQIEVTCDGILTSAWIPAELGIVRNPAGLVIPIV
jgi:Bacterial SH3 domain